MLNDRFSFATQDHQAQNQIKADKSSWMHGRLNYLMLVLYLRQHHLSVMQRVCNLRGVLIVCEKRGLVRC